jgi:hypothetical protein
MLNSGKKICALCEKKKIRTLVLSEKNLWTKQKAISPPPPFKLNGRSLIEECLDTLAGNIWYSKLDANSAYWEVGITPEDRKKAAFTTKFGPFECVNMSFGLCIAPGTCTRVMNLVLRGLTWNTSRWHISPREWFSVTSYQLKTCLWALQKISAEIET